MIVDELADQLVVVNELVDELVRPDVELEVGMPFEPTKVVCAHSCDYDPG